VYITFRVSSITAEDMRAEQEYFREKLRRHNRYLHGWGVVCGCSVEAYPDKDHPWQVRVCPGYLITPQGDEVLIGEQVKFDLAGERLQAYDPCVRVSSCQPTGARPAGEKPTTIYLAVCYAECETRPVRIHAAGCGCDEAACEYSRVRDSFELALLTEPPASHLKVAKTNQQCADCADEPWVLLATVMLPKTAQTPIEQLQISAELKRVLYSTAVLQKDDPARPG
jgi:hypothetical protein